MIIIEMGRVGVLKIGLAFGSAIVLGVTSTSLLSPDDAVYMEEEVHRQEYVLNDHGRIWLGSKDKMTPIPWNFGQVRKTVTGHN